MKRIINGKIYNTETATIVANGDNGLNYGDCCYRREELYRTPKGNYFIFDSAPNILPLDEDFNFGGEEYRQNITDWIKDWSVTNINERELELFGIVDA